MKKRRLGKSSLEVSVVGLGCNNFGILDVEASRKVVDSAIGSGITLFDTADIYGNRGGSEEQLGQILGPRRKDIVLATKFGMAMDDDAAAARGSRGYIMNAVEASLRTAADRLDRSLSAPRQTSEDAAGGNAARARRSGEAGQGARDRLAPSLLASAPRGSTRLPAISSRNGLTAYRHGAGRVQHTAWSCAMPRARVDPGHRERTACSLLPYFPLESGLLTGKYKHGAEIPAGTRYARGSRFSDRYMNDENWKIVESLNASLPRGAAARCWNSPSPGCCRMAASPVSSRARHGPSRIEQNVQGRRAGN